VKLFDDEDYFHNDEEEAAGIEAAHIITEVEAAEA
jgi:hypothetical protein